MWRILNVNNQILRVKTRLLELGYIDNEWLEKYLEMLEANLDTARNCKSTQAHHAIPVNNYWTSDEPYNRKEALKLARLDTTNFEVHLLYTDHLLIHSYLTLCTNLAEVQRHYEAQAEVRKRNSAKASNTKPNVLIMPMPKYITEEKILAKLAKYDTALENASDDKTRHKYRTMVAQWKSKYMQYLADPEKYCTPKLTKQPEYIKDELYHKNAQIKRELKNCIDKAHQHYIEVRCDTSKNVEEILNAKNAWKQAIANYKNFCMTN